MRSRLLLFALATILLVLPAMPRRAAAATQAPASPRVVAPSAPDDRFWDDQFAKPGVEGIVFALALAPNGDLYAGGMFSEAGGLPASNIARWDGRAWHPLGAGITGLGSQGGVFALAVQGADLYAAGMFSQAGGLPVSNIARWDGRAWHPLGTGITGGDGPMVSALTILNGSLVAGGTFAQAGGGIVNNIARWDGATWSGLAGGVSDPDQPTVAALLVWNNQLYAGGAFTQAGAAAALNLARWDGAAWRAVGGGVGTEATTVRALAASGGNLYAGGNFTAAGGVPASNIARWDGAAWQALGSGTNAVRAIAVRQGKVLVAETVSSTQPPYQPVRAWDGAGWAVFGPALDRSYVASFAQNAATLYMGGWFASSQLGSDVRYLNNLIQLKGNAWEQLGQGTRHCQNSACDIAANDQGVFASNGGSPIVRWDGLRWTGISPFFAAGGQKVLAGQGADLYLGGIFAFVPGSPNIARWDGAAWHPLGSGANGPVKAIAVAGAQVYIAGTFTQAGGAAANGLAAWNGAGWSAIGSGVLDGAMPGEIRTMRMMGSQLIIAGRFTSVNGVPANNIARWDGTGWHALGQSPAIPFTSLAVQGGVIYGVIGNGVFGTAIMRWDGAAWTTIGAAEGTTGGYVGALEPLGSDLIAAGHFSAISGAAASNIARWDGSAWRPLGSGLASTQDYGVWGLARQGNSLYAQGSFQTAGGRSSLNVARWNSVRTPIYLPVVVR